MINVRELINDPDFAQPNGINIIRRTVEIIITIASDTTINMTDTADRSIEEIHVFTYKPLMTTGRTDDEAVNGFLSDLVVWQNVKYKVIDCMDDAQYGFCRSTATKIRQDVM